MRALICATGEGEGVGDEESLRWERGRRGREDVRRKRMTEAITPALKPTPLCVDAWSAERTPRRGNGEHARLDDEVRHCNPFQPRAPRRAGRVSEWTGDITRQRSGRAGTYSSGQTADSSVSGCVSPGHKFNLPFVRRCSRSTWVSVLRTWSKVGESELWALKGPTGVVNVPEPRASV